MSLADVQIPLPALARTVYKLSLVATVAVVAWAVTELGWLAREFRTATHDAGMARSLAASADGKTVYLATGNALLRSQDGGATWTQVIPQQPQQAPSPPAPSAAPVTVPPLTPTAEPQNTEPRTAKPK